MSEENRRIETFERHRERLFSVAYGMLGELADAEDAVQDAYLRWQGLSDERIGQIRSPGDYLSAVVTRLSIDRLRRAKARREKYVGTWLPEPLFPGGSSSAAEADTAEGVISGESLSMGFLVVLESLGPVERAVFLLGEVFGYGYGEISRLVGKSETNCRQIAHRARLHVAARRPRFEHSPEQEKRLTESFLEASLNGDMDALLEMLSDDIILYSDGGGNVSAALNPIYGADNVSRFVFGVLDKVPRGFVLRHASINSRPGVVGYYSDGRPQSVTTFDIAGDRIRAVRLVLNPEKLGNVPSLEDLEGEESL